MRGHLRARGHRDGAATPQVLGSRDFTWGLSGSGRVSGTGPPQHEVRTRGHERSREGWSPNPLKEQPPGTPRPPLLLHLQGTPPTCPGHLGSRDNSLACPNNSSQSARGCGRGLTFESRAGPSIFRLLGLKWVGLRRGRGGARTGHKPVLARVETRKTPAEPAAGAAVAEAAGAAASRPPASPSALVSRREEGARSARAV